MLAFGRAKPIERGSESTVFPAAIKVKNDPGDAKREYAMQRMCASAYVVPVEYLEISRAIVMPAAKMDLFAFLASKQTIERAELWRIVRQMCAAIAAVHDKLVVHRDVKLENFLCFDEEPDDFDDFYDFDDFDDFDDCGDCDNFDEGPAESAGPAGPAGPAESAGPAGPAGPVGRESERHRNAPPISSTRMVVRLTDFGLAAKLGEGEKLTARVGSLPYAAPEIFAGAPYDAKADVWSFGVCVFMLLTKCAPFDVSRERDYANFAKVAQARWIKRSKDLTGAQRAVVTRSLTVEQDRRASSKDVLKNAKRA